MHPLHTYTHLTSMPRLECFRMPCNTITVLLFDSPAWPHHSSCYTFYCSQYALWWKGLSMIDPRKVSLSESPFEHFSYHSCRNSHRHSYSIVTQGLRRDTVCSWSFWLCDTTTLHALDKVHQPSLLDCAVSPNTMGQFLHPAWDSMSHHRIILAQANSAKSCSPVKG